MAYNVTGGGTYLLASSIGSSDTTILLTSFTEPVSGTPYTMAIINSDICYATIAPKTANTEFISFTGITQNVGGTATLTGVTRGLSRSSPFTSSASFKLAHSAQTQLILSNSPQQINEYVTLRNNETISGVKTFSEFPVTPSEAPTTDYQVSNKKYVDDVILAGGPNASTTTKGVVEEATQAEVDTNGSTGGTGAQLYVNPARLRAKLYNDYLADSGIADAYVITPTQPITAYAAGQTFIFKATNANTGASTLSVSGLTTKSIKKLGGSALVAGDIAAGQVVLVVYDGTNFQMENHVGNAPMPLSYLDTTTTLGTSDTKVPSQNAVKTYVDNRAYTIVEITATGANTWICPRGVTQIYVDMVAGGGGGGSNGSANGYGAGGGGGGAGLKNQAVAVVPLTLYSLTVGAGGAKGTGGGDGTDGGNTIGFSYTLAGGVKGLGVNHTGGAAGDATAGSGGNAATAGGAGTGGGSGGVAGGGANNCGGGGGASGLGSNGGAGGANEAIGNDGQIGAGGGGSGNKVGAGPNGGNGGQGIIIIKIPTSQIF